MIRYNRIFVIVIEEGGMFGVKRKGYVRIRTRTYVYVSVPSLFSLFSLAFISAECRVHLLF